MSEGGQKRIKSAEELMVFAEDYFAKQLLESNPLTMPGLARACGLSATDSFMNYRKGENYQEYHYEANRAALRVEEWTAGQCFNKGVNVAGPVFLLKNQGYTDRPEGPLEIVNIRIEGLAAKL